MATGTYPQTHLDRLQNEGLALAVSTQRLIINALVNYKAPLQDEDGWSRDNDHELAVYELAKRVGVTEDTIKYQGKKLPGTIVDVSTSSDRWSKYTRIRLLTAEERADVDKRNAARARAKALNQELGMWDKQYGLGRSGNCVRVNADGELMAQVTIHGLNEDQARRLYELASQLRSEIGTTVADDE